MRVLIGCEQFGKVREAFRKRGHDAWSCDLQPARDNSPYHLQCDVLTVLDHGWDLAIFHPDCTYLTNSAAWAYQEPDYERYPGIGYHQKIKPGTLTGSARREARAAAVEFVRNLFDAPIPKIAIENPRGYLSTAWRKSDQSIQPNEFGDDASKETCLWLKGLPLLVGTRKIEPRWVNGRPRWGNQTDSGQNRLSPDADRAMQRAATYPGIAEAMADQWGTSRVELMVPLERALWIVRDGIDNVSADEHSRCHWAELANALTHIEGELRASAMSRNNGQATGSAGGRQS